MCAEDPGAVTILSLAFVQHKKPVKERRDDMKLSLIYFVMYCESPAESLLLHLPPRKPLWEW